MDSGILAALGSALLWAASVPIVSSGLRRIPEENIYSGLGLGLFTSLIAGTATLGLLNKAAGIPIASISLPLAAAGIFMFPIGTGLYYLCGYAFSGQMEVAAQFSKVKPTISVLLAIAFLGEPLTAAIVVSLCLVSVGLFFLIRMQLSKSAKRLIPLATGLLTALSWALGDVCMKVASSSGMRAESAIMSMLLTGAAATFVLVLPTLVWRRDAINRYWRFCFPFLVHGIVSFAFAYTLFYAAISDLGLSRTVLVTAFWPLLGLLLVHVLNRARGEKGDSLSMDLLYAAIFILCGAVVAVAL